MTSSDEDLSMVERYWSNAIEGLRGEMNRGFDRIERKFEDVVYKGEFTATVMRLDDRDNHLESKMETGFEGLKTQVEAGFQSVENRDATRDRKFNARTTWLLAGAGLISGMVFSILSFVIP